MNVSVNFNLMTTTLFPTWMGLILGYLLVIMPIIRLISTLCSIVTDGTIDRLGAFGCLQYSFSRRAEFKSILLMLSAICRVWLWGIVSIEFRHLFLLSVGYDLLGSDLFLTQRCAPAFVPRRFSASRQRARRVLGI